MNIIDIRPDRQVSISDIAQLRAICNPDAVRMEIGQALSLSLDCFYLSGRFRVLGMEILIREPDPVVAFVDQEIGR